MLSDIKQSVLCMYLHIDVRILTAMLEGLALD